MIGLLIFVKGSKGGSWTGLLIIRSLVGGVWLVGGADGTLSSFSFSTSGVWISLLVGETNEDLEEIKMFQDYCKNKDDFDRNYDSLPSED